MQKPERTSLSEELNDRALSALQALKEDMGSNAPVANVLEIVVTQSIENIYKVRKFTVEEVKRFVTGMSTGIDVEKISDELHDEVTGNSAIRSFLKLKSYIEHIMRDLDAKNIAAAESHLRNLEDDK